MRREFCMEKLSVVLHVTIDYYLRDVAHDGCADALACFPPQQPVLFSSLPMVVFPAFVHSL
jgi:hypothetical protein